MIRPNPIQYWAPFFRTLSLRPHHSPVSKNLTIHISFDEHAFDPQQILQTRKENPESKIVITKLVANTVRLSFFGPARTVLILTRNS